MGPPPGPGVLSVPDDLLIQEILSRLHLSSIVSCLRTCRHFHTLISSSPLLTYMKELEIAGMIDNPACSRVAISINERLEMLREREMRWKNLTWKWERTIDMPRFVAPGARDSFGGMLQYGKLRDLSGRLVIDGIYSTRLPNKVDQEIRWKEINLGLVHLPGAQAIEELDLIACVTCAPNPNGPAGDHLKDVKIHLLQHSTLEPHPLASTPVLYVRNYWTPDGSPITHTSICGDNIAISMHLTHQQRCHLLVWNWKTGVEIGELHNYKSWRMALAFLKDDLIITVDLANESLDVFRIPSSPQVLVNNIRPQMRPIQRLKLPKLEKFYMYTEASCRGDPISLPPRHESKFRSARPFVDDPFASILSIFFRAGDTRTGGMTLVDPHQSFTIIIHRQALLECILNNSTSVLDSRSGLSDSPDIPELSWEEWGIEHTRMFAFGSGDRRLGLSGTKYILFKDDKLQILDFCRMKIAATRAQVEGGDAGPIAVVDQGVQLDLIDYHTPNVYPNERNFFQDSEIITCLPYIVSTYDDRRQPEDRIWHKDWQWDNLFFDEQRVMRTKTSTDGGVPCLEKLDILYFG